MAPPEILQISDDFELVERWVGHTASIGIPHGKDFIYDALGYLPNFGSEMACDGFISLYHQIVQPPEEWLWVEGLVEVAGAPETLRVFGRARVLYFGGENFPGPEDDFESVLWEEDSIEGAEFDGLADEAEMLFHEELVPKVAAYLRIHGAEMFQTWSEGRVWSQAPERTMPGLVGTETKAKPGAGELKELKRSLRGRDGIDCGSIEANSMVAFLDRVASNKGFPTLSYEERRVYFLFWVCRCVKDGNLYDLFFNSILQYYSEIHGVLEEVGANGALSTLSKMRAEIGASPEATPDEIGEAAEAWLEEIDEDDDELLMASFRKLREMVEPQTFEEVKAALARMATELFVRGGYTLR